MPSEDKLEENKETLKREKLIEDGIHVGGSKKGVKVMFITDIGATRTLISNIVFQSIPVERRSGFRPTSMLLGASDTKLRESGRGVFRIELDVQISHEIVVADISDEGRLGMDNYRIVHMVQLVFHFLKMLLNGRDQIFLDTSWNA